MGRRRKYKRKSFGSRLLKRLTRAFFSVLILTAFVLGIAYFVKQASNLSTDKIAGIADPYLSKLGINVDEKKVGQVAGNFIKRATDVGIQGNGKDSDTALIEGLNNESKEDLTQTGDSEGEVESGAQTSREDEDMLFSIAIMADSHVARDANLVGNIDLLEEALGTVKVLDANRVVHVGDLTNLGVINDLRQVKEVMDDSGLSYYTLPGDRDLFQTPQNPDQNFLSVFDKTNRTFTLENYKFVMFNNSANCTPISEEEMIWFEDEAENADFVILSQPLYTEGLVLNETFMGSEGGSSKDCQTDAQQQVKEQRNRLLEAVRGSDAKAVIAGDHHYPSRKQDAEKSSLYHYAVGAIGEAYGEYKDMVEILNVQPEFSLLKVFEDETYLIESVVFK